MICYLSCGFLGPISLLPTSSSLLFPFKRSPFLPTSCLIKSLNKTPSQIMSDSSSGAASYIRVVQHLIEECLLFYMSQEECMEAISNHANIKPVITSTVWKELEKENKKFFEAYKRTKEDYTIGDDTKEVIWWKGRSQV